ncbi:leucine-rich repeat domain-containing protein [Methanolapillus ohkumae]|uniref:Bacterial repeat domain-containing protein n=1 Tax=Methanolapillus ohkumae TaxID=3028298 RepID=A0AA96V6B3_9EURY|nr:hypothetical protein MsAm2_11540 [Methanosarcinaceae archaeon Am2]
MPETSNPQKMGILLILVLLLSILFIYTICSMAGKTTDIVCSCDISNPQSIPSENPANTPSENNISLPPVIVANHTTSGGGSPDTSPAGQKVNLTVLYLSGVDGHYGTISGNGTFDVGQEVTVTATPISPGYEFMKWVETDDFYETAVIDTNTSVAALESYTFTISQDTTLYAVMCGNSSELNFKVSLPGPLTINILRYNLTPSTEYEVYIPQYLDERILISLNNTSMMWFIGDKFFDFNLTSVQIPDTVSSIGIYTFFNCNFTTVTLPQNLTVIGGGAFTGTRLTTITIPKNVETIEVADDFGIGAFQDCIYLTSVTFENDSRLTIIGNKAFQHTNIREIILPKNVTTLGNLSFSNCQNLTTIVIPKNVTTIRNNAFALCSNLTRVEFLGPQPTSWNSTSVFMSSPSVTVYYHSTYASSWSSYTGTKVEIQD